MFKKAKPNVVEVGLDKMDKDAHSDPIKPGRRFTKRVVWLLVAAVSLLVALGVGLGVGLGLTLNRGDDGDDDGSPANAPLPNSTYTGRTFWQPAVNSSWQIVLLTPITIDENATVATPDVDVYDIDLFTNTQQTIDKLHALGKKVICYFSAGSFESGRPDSTDFMASDKGKELDGWPGEYWLQTNSSNVRKIMANRILIASNKACDAIDPDNIDGYSNKNGLGLTEADAIDYMGFLSAHALSYNMSIGLKNAGDIIPEVIDITHFSVNEQCVEYSECTTFAPFINANKPVFHIEYPPGSGSSIAANTVSNICLPSSSATAGTSGFSTVMKNMNLNGWVEYCNGLIAITQT